MKTLKPCLLIALLTLPLVASAGKLAEGYRGLSWGAHETLPAPEDSSCREDPEVGIEWICEQTIGEIPVTTAYAYQDGLFYGLFLQAETFTHCDALMDTLTVAWGTSTPQKSYAEGKLDDRSWSDKGVYAGWTWNKYSSKCEVVVLHQASYDTVQANKKAKAAQGVDDL